MNASRSIKILLLILLCVAIFSLAPLRTFAQGSDDEDDRDVPPKPVVNLSVQISSDDKVTITLGTYVSSGSGSDFLPEVESALGCKLIADEVWQKTYYSFSGHCQLGVAKSGLLRTRTLPLSKLAEATRMHGADVFALQVYLPDTDASELLPPAPHFVLPAAEKQMSSRARANMRLAAFYSWKSLPDVPSAIRIQYGYTQGRIAKLAVILGGVLSLPLILVFWLGRRALRAPREHAPSVWFSYMRYLSWSLNLSLIAWFATLQTLDARQIWQFILAGKVSGYDWLTKASFDAFFWCTPGLIWIFCMVMSRPVQEKLRGISWKRRELVLQSVYTFFGSFVPLVLWLNALTYFSSGKSRTAVLLFFGGIIVKLFTKSKLAKVLGMEPVALTTGDLRDVAFAIAGRLGVQLQQVFLIPSGKGRMANAFARTGNTIAFTDYLLSRMTKREVNFVIAHELTHLQKKHPNKLAGISVGIAAGIGLFAGMFSPFFQVPPIVLYAIAIVGSSLGTYAFTRRFEYEADAGAVAATNDPEAAICGLFKLAELNLHPLQWSAWSEKWITHPSTLRRAKAIAKRAGIPEVSLQAIASRGVEPALHYAMPDATQTRQKVMSPVTKARNLRWIIFAILGVALFPPALFAFATQMWPAAAAHRYTMYGLGIATAIAANYFLLNQMAVWRLDPLVARMRQKLEQDRGIQTQAWGGIPVGLAPSDRPKIYEGMTHWDLGFLFVRSDRICYIGEETSFSLRHDQVTDMKLGPGSPSWHRSQRIYIAWKDAERQTSGVFSIAAAYPVTANSLFRKTGEAFRQLNQWRSARAAFRPLPEQLAQLETPQLREVTSQSPGALKDGGKLFKEIFLTALMAMMVGALFGLPFHLMAYLTTLPFPGHALFPGAGAGWYAVAAGVLIRLLQVAPVFFFKDAPVLSATVLSTETRQTQTPAPAAPATTNENTSVLVTK